MEITLVNQYTMTILAAASGEESYDISSDFPVTTRYVKINFDGNTQGDVYAPMQLRVLGNS